MISNLSNTVCLFRVAACFIITSGSESNHYLTKCFQTVTHFHSNPEVTKNVQYTYRNHEYSTVTFTLSCHGNNSHIHLASVQLSLPARNEDYCLDATNTSFEKCRISSQCHCCGQPVHRCYKAVSDKYKPHCEGNRQCTIAVQSAFLEDCPGREYRCEERCHSRWAEVFYSCQLVQQSMVTDTGVTEFHSTTTSQGIVLHLT